MPAAWFSLRKSLHCRSSPSDVHEPKTINNNASLESNLPTKKTGKLSRCSRSISNLRDVINGSKRYTEKAPSCSPRSIGSSDFLNPISHEVVFSNSACEIKITSLIGTHEGGRSGNANSGAGGQEFVGTVRPGTPGPLIGPSINNGERRSFSGRRGSSGLNAGLLPPKPRASFRGDCSSAGSFTCCHKCGEQFANWVALETHHLSKHAVTELVEGDSSRKIVEMICRTGWKKTSESCNQIERILKVHNMQKTISQFEEYREMVKTKASKLLQKKHPRCLADGNELLRFHGTTVDCSIGSNGSSSVCDSNDCRVCQILTNGFAMKKEGVFTTSTSVSALEGAESCGEDNRGGHKKALIVCRVIAGRVHRALENLDEMVGQTGFDSVAGKMGVYSNIEELYLLNAKALLPCFVVIFKP